MSKTHYSCAELAKLQLPGYPSTERRFRDLVDRESWGYMEVRSRGKCGLRREYAPPESVAKLIASRQAIQADGAAARAALEVKHAMRAQAQVELNAKTAAAVDDVLAQLSVKGRAKFDARFDIVLLWRNFYQAGNASGRKLRRNESFHAFSAAYNAKHLDGVTDAMRKVYGTLSYRTVQRWVIESEKTGIVVMADKRTRKGGGISTIEANPNLEKLVLAVLSEKPHVQHSHLWDIVNSRRVDKETGEILWPEISYSALNRYINSWKEQNDQAHLLNTNPDAWKSKYLSSLGRLDGDIVRLNQRWEMDGTPADWMLRGGRHTASVTIDVFSRRPKILFSKTPRTETNKALLRQCVLEWGVPEVCKTDNGSDYVSREMLLFFEEMGIDGVQSNKFSPWEKAHVESFIKTYLHSLLELLDSFIGHNVAERKGIEARRTFAEQLFKKNAVVEVDMTVDELQALTDAWIEGTYMTRAHGTLGISPFERVASWTGAVRRVESERALDILLWKPVKRPPVITAKGIRYDKADFIHPVLPLHAGKEADIRLDPNDLGRMVVRVDGKFLCVAECPERTGINRAEFAAKARAIQKQWASEERDRARKRRKGLPSTDQMVKEIILDRARSAGKVAMLPRRSDVHDSPALREAAFVAERLDGQIGQIAPDAGVIVPAVIDVKPANSPIPATADARYHKWIDLHARVTAGMPVPEFAIEQVERFYRNWAGGPEGKAMLKKHAPKEETAKPAPTGLAAFIR